MTRILSHLLEAAEPEFRHTINRLEAACGYSCQDIRLTESVNRACRIKLESLKLDPDDTTGEELYQALQIKLKHDDARLIKRLRGISATHISAEGNVSEGIAFAVKSVSQDMNGFGIKNSVAKKILMKNPPKRTMKLLGYRSVTSILKHEPTPLLIAVALNIETNLWVNKYRQAVKSLSARDCESRKIAVYSPNNDDWRKLSVALMTKTRQTLLCNNELQALVILPFMSNNPKAGLSTATLALALSDLNSVQACGSYLRLSQVASDFNVRLEAMVLSDPEVGIGMINMPLSWETVQRFFRRVENVLDKPIELHVDLSEITGWKPVEAMLSEIAPELSFWQESAHLARLDNYKPVSLNVIDNSLNLCNNRSFSDRVYHHSQRALWQEFILRYLRPDLLYEAINRELQPKLATEFIEA